MESHGRLGGVQVDVTPQDSREAMRVVGYSEYGHALQRLDKLISIATEEELAAFDEIVKSRDEYRIYVNLSRRIEKRANNLTENPAQPGDDFARHGLPWMTALARVELGSILAAYTSVPHPFMSIAGSEYDVDQYREMLQDALRTHYWALANDPRLVDAAREFKPDQSSLAYIRRMTLVQALFDAAFRIGVKDYTPEQVSELRVWKATLNKIQARLMSNMQAYFLRKQRDRLLREIASQCQNACNRLGQRTVVR